MDEARETHSEPASDPVADASGAGPGPSAAPGKGGRKKAAVRREEIIAIAADIFAAKGYDGASLRDIADRAGLTKAALYYHFPDKEQIFEIVVTSRMESLIELVGAAVEAAGPDPLDRIQAFIDASATRIDRDRAGWIASSNTFWSFADSQHRARLVERRDAYESVLRQALQDAMDQGLAKPGDPGLIARLLLSGLNALPRWHRPEGKLSAVQVGREYLAMVLDGVLTEKGRAR